MWSYLKAVADVHFNIVQSSKAHSLSEAAKLSGMRSANATHLSSPAEMMA